MVDSQPESLFGLFLATFKAGIPSIFMMTVYSTILIIGIIIFYYFYVGYFALNIFDKFSPGGRKTFDIYEFQKAGDTDAEFIAKMADNTAKKRIEAHASRRIHRSLDLSFMIKAKDALIRMKRVISRNRDITKANKRANVEKFSFSDPNPIYKTYKTVRLNPRQITAQKTTEANPMPKLPTNSFSIYRIAVTGSVAIPATSYSNIYTRLGEAFIIPTVLDTVRAICTVMQELQPGTWISFLTDAIGQSNIHHYSSYGQSVANTADVIDDTITLTLETAIKDKPSYYNKNTSSFTVTSGKIRVVHKAAANITSNSTLINNTLVKIRTDMILTEKLPLLGQKMPDRSIFQSPNSLTLVSPHLALSPDDHWFLALFDKLWNSILFQKNNIILTEFIKKFVVGKFSNSALGYQFSSAVLKENSNVEKIVDYTSMFASGWTWHKGMKFWMYYGDTKNDWRSYIPGNPVSHEPFVTPASAFHNKCEVVAKQLNKANIIPNSLTTNTNRLNFGCCNNIMMLNLDFTMGSAFDSYVPSASIDVAMYHLLNPFTNIVKLNLIDYYACGTIEACDNYYDRFCKTYKAYNYRNHQLWWNLTILPQSLPYDQTIIDSLKRKVNKMDGFNNSADMRLDTFNNDVLINNSILRATPPAYSELLEKITDWSNPRAKATGYGSFMAKYEYKVGAVKADCLTQMIDINNRYDQKSKTLDTSDLKYVPSDNQSVIPLFDREMIFKFSAAINASKLYKAFSVDGYVDTTQWYKFRLLSSGLFFTLSKEPADTLSANIPFDVGYSEKLILNPVSEQATKFGFVTAKSLTSMSTYSDGPFAFRKYFLLADVNSDRSNSDVHDKHDGVTAVSYKVSDGVTEKISEARHSRYLIKRSYLPSELRNHNAPFEQYPNSEANKYFPRVKIMSHLMVGVSQVPMLKTALGYFSGNGTAAKYFTDTYKNYLQGRIYGIGYLPKTYQFQDVYSSDAFSAGMPYFDVFSFSKKTLKLKNYFIQHSAKLGYVYNNITEYKGNVPLTLANSIIREEIYIAKIDVDGLGSVQSSVPGVELTENAKLLLPTSIAQSIYNNLGLDNYGLNRFRPGYIRNNSWLQWTLSKTSEEYGVLGLAPYDLKLTDFRNAIVWPNWSLDGNSVFNPSDSYQYQTNMKFDNNYAFGKIQSLNQSYWLGYDNIFNGKNNIVSANNHTLDGIENVEMLYNYDVMMASQYLMGGAYTFGHYMTYVLPKYLGFFPLATGVWYQLCGITQPSFSSGSSDTALTDLYDKHRYGLHYIGSYQPPPFHKFVANQPSMISRLIDGVSATEYLDKSGDTELWDMYLKPLLFDASLIHYNGSIVSASSKHKNIVGYEKAEWAPGRILWNDVEVNMTADIFTSVNKYVSSYAERPFCYKLNSNDALLPLINKPTPYQRPNSVMSNVVISKLAIDDAEDRDLRDMGNMVTLSPWVTWVSGYQVSPPIAELANRRFNLAWQLYTGITPSVKSHGFEDDPYSNLTDINKKVDGQIGFLNTLDTVTPKNTIMKNFNSSLTPSMSVVPLTSVLYHKHCGTAYHAILKQNGKTEMPVSTKNSQATQHAPMQDMSPAIGKEYYRSNHMYVPPNNPHKMTCANAAVGEIVQTPFNGRAIQTMIANSSTTYIKKIPPVKSGNDFVKFWNDDLTDEDKDAYWPSIRNLMYLFERIKGGDVHKNLAIVSFMSEELDAYAGTQRDLFDQEIYSKILSATWHPSCTSSHPERVFDTPNSPISGDCVKATIIHGLIGGVDLGNLILSAFHNAYETINPDVSDPVGKAFAIFTEDLMAKNTDNMLKTINENTGQDIDLVSSFASLNTMTRYLTYVKDTSDKQVIDMSTVYTEVNIPNIEDVIHSYSGIVIYLAFSQDLTNPVTSFDECSPVSSGSDITYGLKDQFKPTLTYTNFTGIFLPQNNIKNMAHNNIIVYNCLRSMEICQLLYRYDILIKLYKIHLYEIGPSSNTAENDFVNKAARAVIKLNLPKPTTTITPIGYNGVNTSLLNIVIQTTAKLTGEQLPYDTSIITDLCKNPTAVFAFVHVIASPCYICTIMSEIAKLCVNPLIELEPSGA